jgi:hypothetical protein
MPLSQLQGSTIIIGHADAGVALDFVAVESDRLWIS